MTLGLGGHGARRTVFAAACAFVCAHATGAYSPGAYLQEAMLR